MIEDDSSPLDDLFKGKLIKSVCRSEELAAHEIIRALGEYGILNLAYDGEHGRNPGYLFRGEADFPCPLQCSVERAWRKDAPKGATLTASKLKDKEKTLLEEFLKGEGPNLVRTINPASKQESWGDVWWWLSLMQHYERNTRLIDFTRDIRLALYFALQSQANNDSLDLIIYCFPCRDLSHPHDANTNKCPFLPEPRAPGVDMNLVIGCLLDLDWMQLHKVSWYTAAGLPKYYMGNRGQRWGWDRPFYKNPRIDFQRGMFVCPYDFPKSPLKEAATASWLVQNLRGSPSTFNLSPADSATLPAKRIRIPHKHAPASKASLRDRFQLTPATVYLDYQRKR